MADSAAMGTPRRLVTLAGALAAVRLASPRVSRLSARSGVTDAEVLRALPGDDLVPDANHVIDRAATVPAAPSAVWPWLVQLGKERAGWYFPRWVELGIPPGRRGLRGLEPGLLTVTPGERVPDWGPGDPEFEVALVEPERALVYLSMRQKSRNWQWPTVDGPMPDDVLAFSWALVLDPVDETHSRLHLRLRMRTSREHSPLMFVGGLFDWVTVALLFAGLRERLRR